MKLKVGLFGIGLNAYWDQFEQLKPTLSFYLEQVNDRLSGYDIEVVNEGLVDSYDRAIETASCFRKNEVDLIFLYVTTYALSSTVLPVVQHTKVPVVILNLSPEPAIDYEAFNQLPDRRTMTGEWLKFCSACPVPEIANVFRRAGITFSEVTGLIDDDECWLEIEEWIEAGRVAHVMRRNRLGALGTYYAGMLDIYTDLTKQLITFGGHIEILEVDELTGMRAQVGEPLARERVQTFRTTFDVRPDCSEEELLRAAYTSVALDRLIEKYQLGSLAYYYKGYPNNANEDTMSSVILGNTLLTSRGIPVAGEYEIKNAQAMKIMDTFGVGGSFTEYYAMDYRDDVVLMGHDGPAHFQIGQGKTKVRPLDVYHGKVAKGLAVEMQVRTGAITCLSVLEDIHGRLVFLVAEGESVPGLVLKIGNTNSRYRFSLGAKEFVRQWNSHGPAHHCAVGVGHIANKITKLGLLLNVKTIQVC